MLNWPRAFGAAPIEPLTVIFKNVRRNSICTKKNDTVLNALHVFIFEFCLFLSLTKRHLSNIMYAKFPLLTIHQALSNVL